MKKVEDIFRPQYIRDEKKPTILLYKFRKGEDADTIRGFKAIKRFIKELVLLDVISDVINVAPRYKNLCVILFTLITSIIFFEIFLLFLIVAENEQISLFSNTTSLKGSLQDIVDIARVLPFIAGALAGPIVLLNRKKPALSRYSSFSTQFFCGIYDVDDVKEKSNTAECLLPREKEVICVLQKVVNVINTKKETDDKEYKNLLLTGKSGDGKSTILRLIKESMGKDLQAMIDTDDVNGYETVIIDRYDDDGIFKQFNGIRLHTQRCNSYNTFISNNCMKLPKCKPNEHGQTTKPKALIVMFDQFEDFLAKGDFKSFYKFVNYLNKAPAVVVIFCLREDRMSEFISSNPRFLFSEKNELMRFNAERLDVYIVKPTPLNQNSTSSEGKSLEKRVRDCFQKKASDYANDLTNIALHAVENAPSLIEKMLMLYILEQEATPEDGSHGNVSAMIDQMRKDEHLFFSVLNDKLLVFYFDTKLCGTGHYFQALQVLYVISEAARKNIILTKSDIENALCFPSVDMVDGILAELTAAKLIRITSTTANEDAGKTEHGNNPSFNDGDTFRIIHDYIRDKTIDYAVANLAPEVKQSLEYYCAELHSLPEEKKQIVRTQRDRRTKEYREAKNKILWPALIIFAYPFLLSFHFVTDGIIFDTLLINIQGLFVVFSIQYMMLLAVIYTWTLYTNALIAEPNEKRRETPRRGLILYPLYSIAAFVVSAQLLLTSGDELKFGVYFLIIFAIFGMAVMISGLVFLPLSNDMNLAESSQNLLKEYAKRIWPGGLLVLLLCIVFIAITLASKFTLYDVVGVVGFPLILVIMLGLLVYGFVSQMTQVFYARIIAALKNRKEAYYNS